MSTRLWHLRSRAIDEFVRAESQHAAWNTLRNRDPEDFGLIVTAEPDENGDPIPIRTSELFGRRWGRDDIAQRFIDAAIFEGLGDTSAHDLSIPPRRAAESLS